MYRLFHIILISRYGIDNGKMQLYLGGISQTPKTKILTRQSIKFGQEDHSMNNIVKRKRFSQHLNDDKLDKAIQLTAKSK